METITTEEDTVEGNTERKKTANQRVKYSPPEKKGKKSKTTTGKKRKVSN